MNLVVFADFNCPYSWLASARADVLLELRSTDVEWRAVEHDPTISEPSDPVDGERQAPLDRELEEVRGLLQPDEVLPLCRPPVLPNTARAVAAFATAPPQERPALRRRLFTALWIDGRDIGDDRVLRDLGASPSDRGTALASGWRAAWLGTGGPVVPTLVQPDGDVARGVEALTFLAELNAPTAAPPQWPPTDIG